jgi:hypothetical protein
MPCNAGRERGESDLHVAVSAASVHAGQQCVLLPGLGSNAAESGVDLELYLDASSDQQACCMRRVVRRMMKMGWNAADPVYAQGCVGRANTATANET